MCLIFLLWSLQLLPEQLAGGEGIPASIQSGVGWGRDGLCPTAEGEAWPCSLGKALASHFAVPRLREAVAAEITLQENPFPPYLPSGMRLVAYIKVDDLLLPSLLP